MTYIAQCLNSYISVKIDYIPLLRTCGGWASQNNHSSVKKKRAEAACLLASTTNYEKYTSCFHTILVMLCHHCYHPSYEDTERQFFQYFLCCPVLCLWYFCAPLQFAVQSALATCHCPKTHWVYWWFWIEVCGCFSLRVSSQFWFTKRYEFQ